jgi:hypothetical protein
VDKTGGSRVKKLAEKIAAIRERCARCKDMLAAIGADRRGSNLTDRSRQPDDGGAYACCCGLQHTRHKLIVEQQVANMGLLTQTAEPAKEVLGVGTISAMADKGHFKIEDIEACEAPWSRRVRSARFASITSQMRSHTVCLTYVPLPLHGLTTVPLIDCISHRLTDCRLEPCHKGVIKFEIVAAFGSKKPPDFWVLRYDLVMVVARVISPLCQSNAVTNRPPSRCPCGA